MYIYNIRGTLLDTKLIIALVLVIVVLIIVISVILSIRSKLRMFSRSLFGTDSLVEGYKNQTHEYNETPLSLHAMTDVYLPQILRDFPEFEYEVYRNKARSLLQSYFTAVATKKCEALTEECTITLKNNVQGIIDNLNAQNYTQHFDAVLMHDIQIARYLKDGATATVIFEASTGCYNYTTDECGNVIKGSKEEKTQAIYEIGLVYVQDIDKVGSHLEGVGINCPNCGAPVKNLGVKFCDYCGTSISEVNIRAWKFNSVAETSYRQRPY